jgi:hypothetical protein
MRRGQRVQAAPRPVSLSDYFRQPGAPVLRGQLLHIVAILVERRLEVEREIQRSRRWHVRFWRWLTGSSRPATEAEMEAAASRALDPQARTAHDEPDEDVADDVRAIQLAADVEAAGAFEQSESGVKMRDRRGGR